MPLLQVNVLPGYSDEIKQDLCRELTWTVAGVTGAGGDGISVWIHEEPAAHYSRAGQMRTAAPAPSQTAKEKVLAFLAAVEARDLDSARQYLADDFQMCFPGGARFTELSELVEWAKPRYRFVRKSIDSVQVAYEPWHSVVFCHGTLAGEWPNGDTFEGIRFIDRFELHGGQLTRQDVWNDLAVGQTTTNTD